MIKQVRPRVLGACALVLLSACSDNGNDALAPSNPRAPTAPPDAPGHGNDIPPSPTPGQSRAGRSYSIYITVPATGDTFAFTVHEPTEFVGGAKYPLLLYGHGGGDQRITDRNAVQSANSQFNDNIGFFLGHGYGVISMDQRGHGESSGDIRLMDPDYEGRDLLALLDWAEAKLDWLAYGPSADGRDPHNLLLGGIGASYGGAFQLLVHNIDPKQRLDALVPEATYYSPLTSLFPNGVAKSIWGTFLLARLELASNDPSRLHLDPYARNLSVTALTTNAALSEEQRDFLHYHGNAYFCEDRPVATNGGAGTEPLLPPRRSGKVHAMFWQGMRDTLFPFSEAWRNYECLRRAGGEVRLLSYQTGHNATPVVPDPGLAPIAPDPAHPGVPLNSFDNRCGASLNVHDAALAFFDEHLKGIARAADIIPRQPCLSLAVGDAVLVDEVTSGHAGVERDIPATTVVAGVPEVPMVVPLDITAGPEGDVLGGVPRLEIDVQAVDGLPGEPILFATIGHKPASLPALPLPVVWLPVDNQITPIRGAGRHEIDMIGIAERLQPGDELALLLYGGPLQFAVSGSINLAQPALIPVTVTGKIWVPMLGPLPSVP